MAESPWRREGGQRGEPATYPGYRGEGAEAVKERLWTEEDRERCRQVNAEKRLAANLVLGYHGPQWSPENIALLGTIQDEEVAQRTGRTVEAVRISALGSVSRHLGTVAIGEIDHEPTSHHRKRPVRGRFGPRRA